MPTQYKLLDQWMAGDFIEDWQPGPLWPAALEETPVADQPTLLDRAALDFCLGGPFHPGCEMTWPMRHITLYTAPFRLCPRSAGTPEQDYGDVLDPKLFKRFDESSPLFAGGPGDITRWMAVPWQTDTASCRAGVLEQRIRLEAVPDGWWYLAPIPPNGAALTFLTDGDLAAARAARTAAGLAALLAQTRHMQGWVAALGGLPDGPVQAAPAGMAWLTAATGDGWLAAGDAALAGDPLGGQGVAQAQALGEQAGATLLRNGPARAAALADYQAHLDGLANAYRRLLRQVYSAEWPWPDAPFWARRRAVASYPE